MKCPICDVNNACPCAGCAARVAKGDWEIPEGSVFWTRGTEADTCGNCGFTMTMDEWLRYEWETAKSDESNPDMYIPNYPTPTRDLIFNNRDNKVPYPWIDADGYVVAWEEK